MPALLLSERVSTVLRDLVDGDVKDDGVIKKLRLELERPLKPEQEGSFFPKGTIVDHQCVIQIAKWAKTASRTDLELSTLLRGAQIAFPVKVKAIRSPELVETLRRIQLQQEEAEYEEMLYSNKSQGKGRDVPFGFRTISAEKQNPWQTTKANQSEAEDWDDVRRQLGAIANVGLSVAAVVVAVWWAGGNADPIWKTLVALPLSILVAVAEVVLYARHWDNVQKKKEKTTGRR